MIIWLGSECKNSGVRLWESCVNVSGKLLTILSWVVHSDFTNDILCQWAVFFPRHSTLQSYRQQQQHRASDSLPWFPGSKQRRRQLQAPSQLLQPAVGTDLLQQRIRTSVRGGLLRFLLLTRRPLLGFLQCVNLYQRRSPKYWKGLRNNNRKKKWSAQVVVGVWDLVISHVDMKLVIY